ncbi:Methyltransferase type 12 [alpha proteobacterium BAL199]|jgi:SAM-dependent methyltransferase|nr:Methyltransferase type 12 [alpha proteobacterium BAL199]
MTTVGSNRVTTPTHCPVCRSTGPAPFQTVSGCDYWRCTACEATFLDPCHWPVRADEHAHYRNHENDPDDPRYRKFLSALVDPLLARLGPGLSGLDYGCGSGSAAAAMLREAGHEVALYDPCFHPNRATLDQSYDFITCTEVAEHFHHPADEFDRFDRMLRPGGWLAIMTCFQTDDGQFERWHYRRDPTHVVFYREATLQTVASQHSWSCDIPIKDVALMRKP